MIALIIFISFLAVLYSIIGFTLYHCRSDVELWGEEED